MRVGLVVRLSCAVFCLFAATSPWDRGRVIDAVTGRGIPGVQVTAANFSGWLHTVTDANGDFEFQQQTGGWKKCEAPGYKQLSEEEIAGADGSRPESYDAGGVTKFTPILIEMMPLEYLAAFAKGPAFVFGTVIDDAGRPIAAARVAARYETSREDMVEYSRFVETDDHGHYLMKVPSGRVDLTSAEVRCDDRAGGKAQFGRAAPAVSVHLKANERRELTFVLKRVPLYSVRGEIRNRIPPYGGHIAITLDPVPFSSLSSGCWAGAYRKESDTTFSATSLLAGKYLLNGRLSRPLACDTCSTEPEYHWTEQIEVPVRSARRIAVEFKPGIEVTGTIDWDGSTPPAFDPHPILLTNAARTYWNSPRDSHSVRFSGVQPGEYRLVAGIQPEEFSAYRSPVYLKQSKFNGVPVSDGRVVIRDGPGENSLELTLSSKLASCVIRPVDAEHRPLSLYTVVLMQKLGDHYGVRSVESRVSGRCGAVPGDYLLVALTPALPKVAVRPEILEQYVGRAIPVRLDTQKKLDMEVVAIEDHPLSRIDLRKLGMK
jgi:hypothetical protein